jgi:hypothetical protein
MFKIKNTTDLLQNLQDTPMSPRYTFVSLDITNLYSNIPTIETKMILTDTLKYYQTDPKTQQEILMWYDIIRQNMQVLHHHKKGAHLNTIKRFLQPR